MAARVSERGKIAALSFSLLCVSLLLTAYSARHPSVARVGTAALSQVVSPIYAVVDFAQDSLRSLWERYLFLVGVSQENEMLRARLNELEGSRGTLVELQSESARLRALLDLGSVSELRGVAAEVVGDEPSGWGQGVVVNKGSSHGIQIGMAVLHPKGIVGQVVAVSSVRKSETRTAARRGRRHACSASQRSPGCTVPTMSDKRGCVRWPPRRASLLSAAPTR